MATTGPTIFSQLRVINYRQIKFWNTRLRKVYSKTHLKVNMHIHISKEKGFTLDKRVSIKVDIIFPMPMHSDTLLFYNHYKGTFTKYVTLFLPIFYPSLLLCDSVWQLAVYPISIKYVTLSQTPLPEKTPKKLTKQKFIMQQQIQNVIYI
jgi:hypothetical protein